jgi:hypothetical protein
LILKARLACIRHSLIGAPHSLFTLLEESPERVGEFSVAAVS